MWFLSQAFAWVCVCVVFACIFICYKRMDCGLCSCTECAVKIQWIEHRKALFIVRTKFERKKGAERNDKWTETVIVRLMTSEWHLAGVDAPWRSNYSSWMAMRHDPSITMMKTIKCTESIWWFLWSVVAFFALHSFPLKMILFIIRAALITLNNLKCVCSSVARIGCNNQWQTFSTA